MSDAGAGVGAASTPPAGEPPASAGWSLLTWDSEFFGFSIGRVDLDGRDPADVTDVVDQARELGVRCLYGSHDPADRTASLRWQADGWRFVEAATTFDLHMDEPPIPRPEGIRVREGGAADLPALEPIADQLAAWSRFAVDPGFGDEAARRLQRAWVERAAADASGEYRLLVAEEEPDGPIVAFITGTVRDQPRVDTVGTTRRGSGAARYLIEEARRWDPDQPLLGGPIAARNVRALRYVSHCGYHVCEVRYLYHRWLDDAADT